MMRVILCFLLGLPFMPYALKAQDHYLMNNVIPPSPNAASLGLYGEIPVDKYTGVPNISVPLFNISVDDISVPVSLSFHASTHKVGTQSSWVGYGWSLNAGGIVTRSMHGGPDENDFFANIDSVLKWERQGILPKVFYPYLPGVDPLSVRFLKEQMWNIHSTGLDTQPDIFYYNFPGATGKFMFKKNQSVVQIPYQDHHIETDMTLGSSPSNYGSIFSFLVKEPNGLAYTFDVTEETQVLYDYGRGDDVFNSSWHLSKIQSQRSGKTVDFAYSSPILLWDVPNESNSITEGMPVNASDEYNVSLNSSSSFPEIGCRYLETISWEGGKVIFYRSNNRADIKSGGQRLDSLRIVDHSGRWIKSFHCEYTYFSSNKQLELISVTEIGKSGSLLPYLFDYYSGALPAHNSKAQDDLGFYNGAENNTSLVPGYKNIYLLDRAGANRSINTSVALNGVIQKIHYPTGGYSEIKYEPNDYYWPNRRDIHGLSKITKTAVAENCYDNKFLFYDINGNAVLGVKCNSSSETQFSTSLESLPYYYQLTITVEADPLSPPTIMSGDLTVEILDSNGNVLFEHSQSSMSKTTLDVSSFMELNGTYTLRTITALKGTRLKATLDFMTQTVQNLVSEVNPVTSGIRVAQISHRDEFGQGKTINYSYRQKINPNLSTGILLTHFPDYSYYYFKGAESNSSAVLNVVHSAAPMGLLGSLQGSHIVYSEVSEDEQNHGHSRYYYSTFYEQPTPTFFEVPTSFEPPSFFWKNGNLVKQEIFDSSNTLLKQIENKYSYHYVDTVKGFVFGLYGDFGTNQDHQFSWAITKQYSGWARLDSTIENYFANGLMRQVTAFNYNDARLVFPTEVSRFKSDNTVLREVTQYTNDRVKHIISPVLARTNYNGVMCTLSQKYIYLNNKLTKIEEFDNSNALAHSILYSSHNGLKPSHVESSDGSVVSYLWGYNLTSPIAKIEGAKLSDLFFENFEDFQGAGVSSDQMKTGHKSFVGQYSKSLVNLTNGSYVLTWWQLVNANWILKTTPVIVTNNSYTISINSQVDDIRFCPAGCLMTTYTYDALIGQTSMTDPNNITTYYDYDDFGRLKFVRDANKNIVKQEQYNYQMK